MQNNCVSEEMLSRYADGEVSSEEQARIASHLEGCVRCREVYHRIGETAVVFQGFRSPVGASGIGTETPECVDFDQLGLYLDNELSETERRELEKHLSHCEVCRRRPVFLYDAIARSRTGSGEPAPKILLDKVKSLVSKMRDDEITRERCPQCGERVLESYRFCRRCGATVTPVPSTISCMQCGGEIDPESNFCTHCGAEIRTPITADLRIWAELRNFFARQERPHALLIVAALSLVAGGFVPEFHYQFQLVAAIFGAKWAVELFRSGLVNLLLTSKLPAVSERADRDTMARRRRKLAGLVIENVLTAIYENIWLCLAVISFILSFFFPRIFKEFVWAAGFFGAIWAVSPRKFVLVLEALRTWVSAEREQVEKLDVALRKTAERGKPRRRS